ncbi:MAG: TrmB family transcriptional regulator [Candidatus Bathyarchaeales archaeon]
MVEEEFFQILTRLGLTISQAKVYLALLELKKASGKVTAQHSKMARQEVYRVLAELQEKGLVEKIIARPTEFKPVLIEDCLSILIENKKAEIFESQKKAVSLLRKLKKANSNAKAPLQEADSQFILVPEKEVPKKLKRKIEGLQTGLDAITPLNRFNTLFFNFYEVGEKASKRGVKFRLIINKPDDENSLTQIAKVVPKNPLFNLRYVSTHLLAAIAIYDKKEVSIAVSATASINETPVLMSSNPSLLAIFSSYFEALWLTAIECNLKIHSQT